jgi:hypothetical protein
MKWKRYRPGKGRTPRLSRAVIAGGSAMILGSAALGTGTVEPAAASHAEVFPVLGSQEWRICAPGFSPPSLPAVSVAHAVGQYDPHPELAVFETCTDMNVFIQSASYAEGWWGLTECWEWGPVDCNSMWIGLNSRILDATADPLHEWKQTACHEVGHVAGLGHRDPDLTSCMASATASAGIDQHDRDAISDTYPR